MKLDFDEVPKDPGDDSIIMRAIVHWVDSNISATTSPEGSRPCGHIARADGGAWRLALAIQRGPKKRQRHWIDVDPMGTRPDRWPLCHLGPGVWDVSKSVHVEGQMHAFLTIVGVPEPAPWELRDVTIKLKDPTVEDLGDFTKHWLTRIIGACPFSNTSLGLVVHRKPTVIWACEATPAGAVMTRELLAHLQQKERS